MQQQNREVVKLQETADRPAGRAQSRGSTARGGLRSAEQTSRRHMVSKTPPPPRWPQHPCAAISPSHPRPRYRRASVRGLRSVTKAGTDCVPRGIQAARGQPSWPPGVPPSLRSLTNAASRWKVVHTVSLVAKAQLRITNFSPQFQSLSALLPFRHLHCAF